MHGVLMLNCMEVNITLLCMYISQAPSLHALYAIDMSHIRLQIFKTKAIEIADKLLPAFNTPSGIPKSLVNFATCVNTLVPPCTLALGMSMYVCPSGEPSRTGAGPLGGVQYWLSLVLSTWSSSTSHTSVETVFTWTRYNVSLQR